MSTLMQDLRYAARLFRKSPGFALLAIATLALGIGATTVMFSALNALLVRPLPFPAPDRLVVGISLREGFDPFGMTALEYAAYRDGAASLSSSGLATPRPVNLVEGGEPERVASAAVMADYFRTLGIKPFLGRGLAADDDRPGAADVVLLGWGLWQRRFGGDRACVGRTIELDGRPHTVIGVMPRGFDAPFSAEAWVPLRVSIASLPMNERTMHAYEMVARLKDGATLEGADRELRAIASRLEIEYPQIRRGWTIRVIPLRQHFLDDDLDGRTRRSLAAMTLGVGFLLFISCANVANLLLARGVVREEEMAIRLSLGASRARLVRQLMTESVLLSLLGGAAGIALAFWTLPALSSLNPIQSASLRQIVTDFRMDARVLAASLAAALVTGGIFGMLPALRATRSRDLSTPVRQHGVSGGRASRTLSALVIGEIALAAALLTAGSLVLRSFRELSRTELGFSTAGVSTMELALSPATYPAHAERLAFLDRVIHEVRSLPGVTSAGFTTNLPLDSLSLDSVFEVEGRPAKNPADVPITAHRLVSPGYLEALGVTLLRGRFLDGRDRAGALPVAVVSEELARRSWPGEDPIGKRVRRVVPGEVNSPWLTVVGLVRDVKEDSFNFRIVRAVWYLPYAQQPGRLPASIPFHLVLRGRGGADALAGAIRTAVHRLDPAQPVSNVETLRDHVAGVLVADRFQAVFMAAFAAAGLALAVLGLYGVMTFSVRQRAGEVGIRMALGARPIDVVALVMRRGAALLAIGLAGGLAAARVVAHFQSGSLYRVAPGDPPTYLVVAGVLTAAALAACFLPARRAAAIDPIAALRSGR